MNRLGTCMIACYLLILPFIGSAQKFSVLKSENESKDNFHEFFDLGLGSIACLEFSGPHGAFSYKRDVYHSRITIYDERLNVTYTREMTELDKMAYATSISVKKRQYLFYRNDSGELLSYELNTKTGTVELREKLTDLGDVYHEFETGFSSDSTCSFLVCREFKPRGNEVYDVIVFDKEMKVMRRMKYEADIRTEKVRQRTLSISNDGVVSLITMSLAARKKNTYSLIQFRKENDITQLPITDVPDKLDKQTMWQVDHDDLVFVGLEDPGRKKTIARMFAGKFNVKERKMSTINTITLKQEVPVEAELTATYLGRDGAFYLVFDDNLTLESGKTFTAFAYESGDTHVLKIGADLQLLWQQNIVKCQHEPSEKHHTGTVTQWDPEGNMRVFFLDLLENTTVSNPEGKRITLLAISGSMPKSGLACVTVSNDGKAQKQFIAGEAEVHHFSIFGTVTASDNSLIYTAYQYRNIGKSTYKVGKIAITN